MESCVSEGESVMCRTAWKGGTSGRLSMLNAELCVFRPTFQQETAHRPPSMGDFRQATMKVV